ncbi:tRNA-splicing endonuclease subunit Sen2 [Cloeon dipterum]|uniref:tRNA-splicing endonuclease subunit Sen2 n=1 Tax=Cloeon dipterum TaxID=197152 RepID=UPI00321F8871
MNMRKLSNFQPKHHGRGSALGATHPLPIVIESLSGFPAHSDAWPCYSGIFTGHMILVPSKDDAEALHRMGCFGNPVTRKFNSLSEHPPILRQRQFERRNKWAKLLGERQARKESSESEEEFEVPDISELRVPAEDEDLIDQEEREPENNVSSKSTESDDVIVEEEVQIRKRRGWLPSLSDWINLKEDMPFFDDQKSPNTHVIEVDDEITILNGDGEFPSAPNKESLIKSSDDDIEIIMDDRETDIMEVPNDEEMKNSSPLGEEEEGMVVDDNFTPHLGDANNSVAIVINDTDCLGSRDDLIKHWKPQLVPHAFKSCDESSNLSLEEGFFLSWALNCLQISASKKILCEHENNNRSSPQPGPSGLQLNEALIELQPTFSWDLFCQVEPNFPARYAVYHHLRSKGWVVKSGSKFGAEFVVYKDGPSQYHASSVVVIETHLKRLQWQRLLTLNRIAETTSKEVVICRVSWPRECPTDAISWLSKVSISDRVFKRHSLKRPSNGEKDSDSFTRSDSDCSDG